MYCDAYYRKKIFRFKPERNAATSISSNFRYIFISKKLQTHIATLKCLLNVGLEFFKILINVGVFINVGFGNFTFQNPKISKYWVKSGYLEQNKELFSAVENFQKLINVGARLLHLLGTCEYAYLENFQT